METKERAEIMKINQVFAWHMMQLQEDRYAPDYEYEEGEEVVFEVDKDPVRLTKEHAARLNEEDRLEFEENRDRLPDIPKLESVGFTRYAADGERGEEYLTSLGEGLIKLSEKLALGGLIVMGQWNIPWLSQENDHPPAAEALAFLRKLISTDFDGGFVVAKEHIPSFITHLFWLIRCNASLPYFLLGFEKGKTVFELCKYGILHVIYYDHQEKSAADQLLEKLGFEEVPTCFDPVDFDDFEGRRIVL
jgi:hypothetical protein